MAKIKCHICKAKNNETVCERCGASLATPHTEQLVLYSDGYTFYNEKGNNRFSYCKVALTNKRLVIYRIRPEADNPAFGLFKDFINAVTKNPCISIDLSSIESVKRYGSEHIINTSLGSQVVSTAKFKEFDEMFAPYKQEDEK